MHQLHLKKTQDKHKLQIGCITHTNNLKLLDKKSELYVCKSAHYTITVSKKQQNGTLALQNIKTLLLLTNLYEQRCG